MQIAGMLAAARSLGVDRLDVQLLLSHHLGQPRSWLLAHDGDTLPDAIATLCLAQLQRRAAGEPLAYLLGEWQFRGLGLQVSPAVLIPRPETELLVDWALECLTCAPLASVVDLGTGSGAIALALAAAVPGLQVTASDASGEAVAMARSNASRLQLPVRVAQGDWWEAVAGQRFGLAVSNPPYVAAGDAHLDALRHEPRMALTPGGDSMCALRRIIDGAPAHLLPGAWLLLEHGHDQAEAVRALLAARGFSEAQTRRDLAGLPRCSGGCWTPSV
ncbi:MAG: peptide chain release factor N(5)-glutamine methyltransferase [Burkholderiales bacterium]|jgi:release factor glutamine methyltransferase